METLEQNQATEVFSIKRQKVEKLDEKSVEELQKKFLVNFKRSTGDTPRIMREWISGGSYPDYFITLKNGAVFNFPYFTKSLEKWVDNYGSMVYDNNRMSINSKSLFLFKIDQAFIKDWVYFFYTSDWQILTANKSDFDKNWIEAESLEFFWNQTAWADIRWKTRKSMRMNWTTTKSDGDWFIHFYANWKNTLDIPWDNIFQIEPAKFLISDGWNLYQYQLVDYNNYKKLENFSIPFKGITQMAVDYNKNFLFIVNETDEWSTLHIISYDKFMNQHEIEEIYSIKNVKEICWLWRDNWMICLMSDNSLQYYRNTFAKFKINFFKDKEDWTPWWKLIYPKDQEITTVKDSGKDELLKELKDGTLVIDFDEEVVDETDKLDNDIIDTIWNYKIPDRWMTLKELYDNAKDEESIKLVLNLFKKIRKHPSISKYASIIKGMEQEIIDKQNKILLESIFTDLWEIEEELGWQPDLRTLMTLKERLEAIQRKRRTILISNTPQDKTLKELLSQVKEAIKYYQESNKEEYMGKIDENLWEIKEILDWYDYITSVTKIRTTPIRKETEDMLWLLDATTKSEYETKMNTLEINRINELKDISTKQKEEQSQQINKIKSDIKWKMDELKLIFSEINEADEIEDLWDSNELVLRINEKVKELPNKDADEILLQLRRTFEDVKYQSMISSVDSVWIVRTLDNFWIDTSLYYDEDWSEKVEWKLSWKQQPNWKISLTAVVTNWETHKYDKSLYLESFTQWEDVKINWHTPKFDMTEEEFYKFDSVFNEYLKKWKQEMKKLSEQIKNETDEEKKKELRKSFKDKREYYKDARYVEILMSRLIKQQKLNPRSKVPPRNPNYIVLDEEKEILKTLSARLRCQKKYGWIDILEWWPGLWKTVMCEFLANVTNREIVVVACGKIDPETMICSPGMKGNETIWEQSDWVKLMQKPWTLIVFDEIDKLPPSAIAKLHSLFDTRKSVYHEFGGTIKANPDCLFMGTRNLYDTLSNPIASRARILRVTYPSAINEAYKISKYADKPILNVMKYEDFCALYDKYIVRQEPEPKNSREKELYQEIINIDKLLQVFTKLRELFSEDAYNYEISYRDAQQVYIDYNNWVDFKTATMNALLWWAWAVTEWDKEEKQEQINTVKSVIDSIM